MTRQWAPGDVVSALLDGNEIVGLVRGGGRYVYYADSVTTDHVAMKHLRNIRPLVVIDPEDREQVERLAEAYCSANPNVARMPSTIADRLTNALHEFADPTPPKPAEPLGLGAVVEDVNGRTWVRYLRPGTSAPWLWSDAPANVERLSVWSAIDAVRVLSEGIS